jgi:tetratricopeptide (TPR) repeat protein
MGTPKQTQIISNYPTQEIHQKLKVPYIEKQNGNLCIQSMNKPEDTEEDKIKAHKVAVGYYNKALLSLKMLFSDNQIEDEKLASRLIMEIELPVCNNLAICYLKTDEPHYAIKYTSQVLEKNLLVTEKTYYILEKAYYRRALSYLKIGSLTDCKSDLTTALALVDSVNTNEQTLVKQNKTAIL